MIETVVTDIYERIKKKDGWFTDELAKDFSQEVARRLQIQFNEDKGPPTLRLSQMGPKCPCALWHSIRKPHLAERLPPWAEVKYAYGHIIEALALVLIKASGHTVLGEQDEVFVDGVKGHRDCVIDGCIVDVKSTSSRGFTKFKDGTLDQSDDFGYLDQLDGYLVGSLKDDLVRVKDRAYILAIDKQLGHIALYKHHIREEHIRNRIKEYKNIVDLPEPPECTCKSIKDGESGNMKLDLTASYSPYKYCCKPNLRTFLYADGPRYLTTVIRRPAPHIVEIDKDGRVIYGS